MALQRSGRLLLVLAALLQLCVAFQRQAAAPVTAPAKVQRLARKLTEIRAGAAVRGQLTGACSCVYACV